jgi:phosphate transport system protein
VREDFHLELQEINQVLSGMVASVRAGMALATKALLEADAELAEEVVARDEEIDTRYRILEDKVYSVMARQAPVASDLRLVLTALHIAVDLERMGDMAEHVGRAALRRLPEAVVPEQFVELIQDMGATADRMSAKLLTAFEDGKPLRVFHLERDDDAMDKLHHKVFAALVAADGKLSVEAAIDVALLAQFYERYGDHIVNVGRQVVFLVTGEKADRK